VLNLSDFGKYSKFQNVFKTNANKISLE